LEYQLVSQVRNVDAGDFERLLGWQKSLAECLTKSATIDGHDFGSGEFNIFIFTDNPEATFRTIQSCRENQTTTWPTAAAYRHTNRDDYIVLWPAGQERFDVA
jgi:hypothetical protein